jgi:hypothetical protein
MQHTLRYKNPSKDFLGHGRADVIYNRDALIMRETVFVNEGIMDALIYGKEGIAMLSWQWTKEQKDLLLESTCKNLVIVPDKGFYKEAVKSSMFLLRAKKVFVLNIDTILQDGEKDSNDVGFERMSNVYKITEPLTFGRAIKILSTK